MMFYLRYIAAELRRRRGRTLLTSLGLGVGVGLVAIVVALSNGLDNAQSKVLEPLTGVGTDMSVTRPILISGKGPEQSARLGPGGGALSGKERRRLLKENGDVHAMLPQAGELPPGTRFSRAFFVGTELSFPQSQARRVAALAGVDEAAPVLTLNLVTLSGAVPRQPPPVGAPQQTGMSVAQQTVTGVDPATPTLAPVTPAQISDGRYFRPGESKARAAILGQSYANRKLLGVGERITLDGRRVTIIGIAKPPLGGQASDVYLPLDTLQEVADREGRVNALRVRAASTDQVASVAGRIKRTFAGAQVTTARDLADRISGSLTDAKDLSDKLGAALAVVALVAAVLVASLLTLSSVNKRTRELGTLKAIGWRRRLVVRQVAGESLAQGSLGGVLGVLIGVAGTALISAFGPTLEANVVQRAPSGQGFIGTLAQGQLATGSRSVALSAPLDASMLVLAIALALAGGLIAGAVGARRVARLRPADALRSVE
jgi:ABC-type antimicrobial peptide transport system permease subunit